MSIATAIARAVSTAQSAAGMEIAYRRNSEYVAGGLTAVKSVVRVELDGGDGTTVEGERVDWILEAADLILGGQQTEPVEGDRIEETTGGKTCTYEAMPVGTEACWRRCDPQGQAIRVHSKLVEVQ